MIEIVLFTKGEKLADMDVLVVPRIGETIILDCGLVFKVTDVVHQFSDPELIQLGCERVEVESNEE